MYLNNNFSLIPLDRVALDLRQFKKRIDILTAVGFLRIITFRGCGQSPMKNEGAWR